MICSVLKVKFGCLNKAVSTYARVMNSFGLSKSTLNCAFITVLPKLFPYKIAGTGALTPKGQE